MHSATRPPPTSATPPAATPVAAARFGCRAGSKRAGRRGHLRQAAEHGARFLVDCPGRSAHDRGRSVPSASRADCWSLDVERPADGVERPFRVHATRSSSPRGRCGPRSSCCASVRCAPLDRARPAPASGACPGWRDAGAGRDVGRPPAERAVPCNSWPAARSGSDYPAPPTAPSSSSPRHRILASPARPSRGPVGPTALAFMERLATWRRSSHWSPTAARAGSVSHAPAEPAHRLPHLACDARTSPSGARRDGPHRARGRRDLDRRRRHPGGLVRSHGRTDERAFRLPRAPRRAAASRRTAPGSSRPTRWAARALAVDAVTSVCDPWGRVRADARGASSPASTSATARSFRPPRRQPAADHHGARRTRRANGHRRELIAAALS